MDAGRWLIFITLFITVMLDCLARSSCCLVGVSVIGKTASQSSQFISYDASRAIDGNIGTWSETNADDPHPWWQMDLGDRHCLGRISITLTDYCCERYFIAAVVRVGLSPNYIENQQCGSPATEEQSQKGNRVEFMCDPSVSARYVSVDVDPARPGALSPPAVMIMELAVEEYTSGKCTSTSVPVFGKTASQSSQFISYDASRAIDGDIGTWSETGDDPHPWWQLNLGGRHCLGRISITLTDYCCVVRAGLSPNYIENQQCGSPATKEQSQPGNCVEFICDPPVFARYVSVDMDPTRPGASNPPRVMIMELAVAGYASVECSSSTTSPGIADVFQQTMVATAGEHTTIKDNNEMHPSKHMCPKGVVTPSAVFKLVHEGRCISTTGPLATVSASTIMDCTMRCKRCTNCTIFDYVTATRRCRLYSQQVQLGTHQTNPEQGCHVYRKVV